MAIESSSKKVEIQLLDTQADYYAEWALRLEIYLDSKECLDVTLHKRPVPVAGVPSEDLQAAQKEYDTMDRKARGYIIRFLGPYALNIIRPHKASAYNMWEALREAYQNQSASNQANLLIRLLTTKMKEEDKLESHLSAMEALIADLRAAGVAGMEDQQLLSIILLLSLPVSYSAAVTAITMMAKEDLKLEGVKIKLINHKINKEVIAASAGPSNQTSNSSQPTTMMTGGPKQ